MTISRIPLTDVRPDPKQPRTHFNEPALKALATSIRKLGQRTPISVRQRRAGASPPYEIIDGERRWRACKLAGVGAIKVCVEEATLDKHATQHRLSVVANFMREGHTHMEMSEAISYQVAAAVEEGQTNGQAVAALAEDLGKSAVWVYSYLRLQSLCALLKERLHPDTPDQKRLRMVEAQALCDLTAAQQQEVYRQLVKAKPHARTELAKRLAGEMTGTERRVRACTAKVSISRFISRLPADVERILQYKQSDFRAALGELDTAEMKGFRSSVAVLLDAIDRTTQPGRAR